jgi:glutamyl-tRNA(Gln) amidotransferase subunit E
MLDYAKLGFRCGIEIHQQLATENKLFCNCSAAMSDPQPVFEIRRRLRPVSGEMGDIDTAAAFETLRGKTFIYKVYLNETCLVELDEEPIHPLNPDALDISFVISTMLNCEIPDEIHVMRKTVIDGSNTSGFQRTAIVGMNGWLETESGKVGIDNVSVEEDACQILERRENEIVYGLNRLAIPLVEIGTDSSIRNPQHAKEVAARLGMILRSTDRVKRGLGTIRQDINISIRDGARIEIKGAQDLSLVPKYVENETLRQASLIQIRDKLKRMRFKPVRADPRHVSHIFRDSKSHITKGKQTYSIVIPGFAGFLKTQLTPTRTLGNEIASYIKVRIGARGFVHSDEDLSKYGLEEHFESLRKHHRAGKGDTVLIVSGDKQHCHKTLDAIVERINKLLEGVPEEVRRALDNGDSEFMRPLPGAARMYPETDAVPISITPSHLRKIKSSLPELLDSRVMKLETRFKISHDLAYQVVHSGLTESFTKGVSLGLEPTFVSSILTSGLTQLRRKDNVPVDRLTDKEINQVLELSTRKKLPKESVLEMLSRLARNPNEDIQDLVSDGFSEDKLREIIRSVISRNRSALRKHNPKKILMGEVMKEVRGKASGKLVMKILSEEIKCTRKTR